MSPRCLVQGLRRYISSVDQHIIRHVEDILNYLSKRGVDPTILKYLSKNLRTRNLGFLEQLLFDDNFLSKCVEESPSTYHAEKWRKRADLKFIIDGYDFYFTLVFSKTSDNIRIITAFPDREGKNKNNIFVDHTKLC